MSCNGPQEPERLHDTGRMALHSARGLCKQAQAIVSVEDFTRADFAAVSWHSTLYLLTFTDQPSRPVAGETKMQCLGMPS